MQLMKTGRSRCTFYKPSTKLHAIPRRACRVSPPFKARMQHRRGVTLLSLARPLLRNPLHIKDHSIEHLRERLAEAGERPYRADQIAAWLYRRGVEDPEQMTDLGAELRARLAREWQLSALEGGGGGHPGGGHPTARPGGRAARP